MAKVSTVFVLQLALGAFGASAILFALFVGLGQVTFTMPSAQSLAEACQRFVPALDARSIAVLALGGFSFAVVAVTVRSGVRRARASRAVVRSLRVLERRRVGTTTVHVFAHRSALAFCAGLLRPQVYVSTETLRALTADELEAVIAHEQHHARQHDPLRVFIANVIADGLFFAPALRRVAERYSALAELAADRAAVRARRGDASSLASALLAFESADPAVVGIAPERVDHLLGDAPQWALPLAMVAWGVTLMVGVAAVALRLETVAADPINLPLLAAQFCMLLMALVPIAAVGGSALGARRLFRRLRRR